LLKNIFGTKSIISSRRSGSERLHQDVDSTFNKAVSEGLSILGPVMDKFYGDRSGYLKDSFGHLWAIATRNKNLTQDQVKKTQKTHSQKWLLPSSDI
jgi:PhnB protein